jgi:hypothetical protein
MTYAVVWTAAAVAELARYAGTVSDPSVLDRETVWMDSILRRYPYSMGESRWGAHRIWYADRVGVWYVVDDAAMTVRILSAGPARRR